jgi:1-acyl-sn-glycerol-3-phosphate acyltransferase
MFRLIVFAAESAIMYAFFQFGKLILSGSPQQWARVRGFLINCWGRLSAWTLGMTIEYSGPRPHPPFYLVSNHLSYVDIIVYAALLDCVFVSRADVARWPGIGLLAEAGGTIFLNREKIHDIPRVIGLIDQKLHAGQGVIVFPEGTSTKGESVLPFKASLLEPAARGGYPVSYASLRYLTPPGGPHAQDVVCWWGDSTFVPHLLTLLAVPRFKAIVTFGELAIQSDDRKGLAKNLWDAVNDQFVPSAEPSGLERNPQR